MMRPINMAQLAFVLLCGAPSVHCIAFGRPDATASPEPRTLIEQTIERQNAYVNTQNKYACVYQIIKRNQYDSGRSVHAEEQSDQVIILHGGELKIVNVKTGKDVKQKHGELIPFLNTFAPWNEPLFQAVMEHSVLSYEGIQAAPPGHQIKVIDFTGNPTFSPNTDTERLAQSLTGRISIDLTVGVFTLIEGDTEEDVVDGKRFIAVGRHPGAFRLGMPLLDYGASLYRDVYMPAFWSNSSYRAVVNGPKAISKWTATLSRTFMQRTSCQVYHVSERILPGFEVVPPNAEQ